jgi:hypothetical protein
MKYAGRNAWGQHVVGALHREWSNGITIEYENGVREFINTARVIGRVEETERDGNADLFGPVR